MTRTYGTYRVSGRRPYRGHQPGEVFDAILDPGAENRAVNRGDIQLLGRTTPAVQPGSYAFPEGWPDPPATSTTTTPEAREAGLSH